MRCRYAVACFLIVIFAQGCGQTVPPPPALDPQSPDALLKSLWARYDWHEELAREASSGVDERSAYDGRAREAIDRTQAERDADLGFRSKSKILSVEIESSTRAVLLSSEFSWPRQKNAQEFTYIFTKNAGQWEIEDRYQTCYSCQGTGKKKDWENREPGEIASFVKCTTCDGDGHISSIFPH